MFGFLELEKRMGKQNILLLDVKIKFFGQKLKK